MNIDANLNERNKNIVPDLGFHFTVEEEKRIELAIRRTEKWAKRHFKRYKRPWINKTNYINQFS